MRVDLEHGIFRFSRLAIGVFAMIIASVDGLSSLLKHVTDLELTRWGSVSVGAVAGILGYFLARSVDEREEER